MIRNNNFLFKTIFLIFCFSTFIMFLPTLASVINLIVEDKDILIQSKDFKKKEVVIDSLQFLDMDGSDSEDVYGYSKDLNNYKIEIKLGSVNDESISQDLGMDYDGTIQRYVWYKNGSKFAYKADKKDLIFPLSSFLFNRLKILLIFIFSLCTTFVLYKIAKKKGMFNKKNNKV